MACQRPNHPANTVAVSFQGAALGSFTPSGPTFQQVTSASFVAIGTTGTITFSGQTGGSDTGTGLDDVSVVEQ